MPHRCGRPSLPPYRKKGPHAIGLLPGAEVPYHSAAGPERQGRLAKSFASNGTAVSRTYLFSGGGTGGHLFPGLAVAEELRAAEPEARVVFVGSGRAIEREIVAVHGYQHVVLPVEPSTTLRRNPLKFAWRSWGSLREAAALLARERPASVIGLGGFASVPVVWAASRQGIPAVLLEQNIVAGRATRLLSRRASLICLSFSETIRDLARGARTAVTGNPVRREIAALHENGHRCDGRTLLVLGGSQGAVAVNDSVLEAVEALAPELAGWEIIHQTGQAGASRATAVYRRLGLSHDVRPFFDDLSALYASATLAVSRAGATTLAELACAGCPAILIPYPNSVRDHQRLNSLTFERSGAARVVEQAGKETAVRLRESLGPLLSNSAERERMRRSMHVLARPRAAQDVAVRVFQRAVGRADQVPIHV